MTPKIALIGNHEREELRPAQAGCIDSTEYLLCGTDHETRYLAHDIVAWLFGQFQGSRFMVKRLYIRIVCMAASGLKSSSSPDDHEPGVGLPLR